MTNIALFGAGEKIGIQSAWNLTNTDFDVAHVEISETGRQRLKEEIGRECVPTEEAARDFPLGHMNILAAVTFGHVDGVFSDACCKAIENGLPVLMKEDWKRVFDPDETAASIERIT